ncbi:exodeoxyribonuclease VII small subunit [Lagierella massiliensis]|uniref:exodeoxyribonuclease VII small subunit n=1 Tax=Lagierella massiliensis TaxID=1689303 RepID=UPI0006D78563|nr:exodeoxyribonuclease VII small subunit [Lagierella massiliensis]
MENNFSNYEDSLNRLEEILEKLEDDNITLEENVKLYEEALMHHKKLMEILDREEGKIRMMTEDGESDFDPNILNSDE